MRGLLDRPLAFVDIETTGSSPATSRVLEVGVVRVEGNRVVGTYQSLVQPDESVPSWITRLTGIADDYVAEAPRFEQAAAELRRVLDGAVFVAHNVWFDYGFLRREFGRLEMAFGPPLLCTVALSRRLFPEYRHHRLADLIERHGLVTAARHRAFDDAEALWQFYRVCLREFDLDAIEAAVRAQLGGRRAAVGLPRGLA